MIATIIEIILVAVILIALVNEDRLIAWEDRVKEKVLDFFAFCCAEIILGCRYIKWWVRGVRR